MNYTQEQIDSLIENGRAPLLAEIEKLKAEVQRLKGPFTCDHEPEYAGGACAVCHAHALDALETIEKATAGGRDVVSMSVHSIAKHGFKHAGGPSPTGLYGKLQVLRDVVESTITFGRRYGFEGDIMTAEGAALGKLLDDAIAFCDGKLGTAPEVKR